MAGYGIGSLAGPALLMAVPLRGDADRLTAVLALVVAVSLAVVVVVPGFVMSFVALGLAGIANSLFFAATLAARSEYAPAEARGQVFIWVGALKIAAGSAGTAVAGVLIGGVAWLPVVVVVELTAVSVVACAVERRHQSQR